MNQSSSPRADHIDKRCCRLSCTFSTRANCKTQALAIVGYGVRLAPGLRDLPCRLFAQQATDCNSCSKARVALGGCCITATAANAPQDVPARIASRAEMISCKRSCFLSMPCLLKMRRKLARCKRYIGYSGSPDFKNSLGGSVLQHSGILMTGAGCRERPSRHDPEQGSKYLLTDQV